MRREKPHGMWNSECGIRNEYRAHSKFPIPNSEFRRGFTLVELLVVVAILAILMSLVTAGAQAARRRASISRTKATVAALETSIAMYYADLSEYPATGNAELVKALSEDPGDEEWFGPYMEFKQDELVNGELVDAWGHPYVYVSANGGSPQHREHSFDLYSVGPNGSDDQGGEDDIVNW